MKQITQYLQVLENKTGEFYGKSKGVILMFNEMR